MNTIISLTIRGDSVLCGIVPRFKCFDPAPIIAASAATTQAVANHFAGSSATSDSDAARAYDFWKSNTQRQAQLQDLERAYHENQVNRDWSEAQRISEQDWQEYLQKEMFRMQNNYNTPARQVSRLLAGGLLPAGVFGQTGSATTPMTGAPSAPGTPSGPSAPGIPTPASGGVPPFLSSAPYDSMMGSILGGAAQVMDTLASARQKGADTKKTEAEVPLLIERYKLDNGLKNIELSLSKQFGQKKASLEVGRLRAETEYLVAKMQREYSEKGYIDEKSYGERFRSLISSEEVLKARKENDMLDKQLGAFEEQFHTTMATMKSEQARNYAAAEQSTQASRYQSALADVAEIDATIAKDPTVVQSRLEALQNSLLKDNFKNLADYEEALRRLKRIREMSNFLDNNQVARMIDSWMTWFTGHVGVAINGSFSPAK